MRTGMLLLCLGLALTGRLSTLPPVPLMALQIGGWLNLMLLTGIYLLALDGRWRSALCLLLCFTGGLLWSLQSAMQLNQNRLPYQLEGQDFWVEGRISGLVRQRERTQQIQLRVQASCFRLQPVDCTDQPPVLVGSLVVLNDYSALPLKSGEQWRLRVRLNRVHGFANPGGYDFEAAQAQQGIVARGYVRETGLNVRLQAARPDMNRLRTALGERIQHLPDLQYPGLLRALVTGDRDGISSGHWSLLTATGTNHLLVISGLHVGFVALVAWWAGNLLSRLSTTLILRVPAQRVAAALAILAALLYSALAGFSLPTQRAMIMVCVAMVGQLLGRRFLPSYSFLLAMSIVLLLDPLAATQAGFWLSFTAVGALLLAFTGHIHVASDGQVAGHGQRIWQGWIKPQWVVSIALLVPLLLWTGQVSVISPLANIIAIPLVSFWVVPLALGGSALLWIWPGAGDVLLVLADLGLQLLLSGLQTLAQQVSPLWQSPPLSGFTALCAALACLLFLLPKGLLPRWPAVLLLTPLIWPPAPQRPAYGTVWLHMLDVGQGLAVLVQTTEHLLVFDTGPRLGPDVDAGRSVVLPVLRQLRVERVDTVIVSHWHEDHYGGLNSVLAASQPVTRPSRLLTGSPALAEAPGDHQFAGCRAGDQWQWDGVLFQILHPDNASYRGINDQSCVVMVDAGGQRILLSGDIEQAAELSLVRRYAGQLRADVLLAPHHGSNSSSSPALLASVQPQWLLVSAGYRNRFDHPGQQVLARARQAGIDVLRTDISGAVQMVLGEAQGPRIKSLYREQSRRFWHNIPSDEYGKVPTKSAGD